MKLLRNQKNLKGKTVIIRSDLDEPHQGGKLLDDYRIRMSVASIKFLHEQGAKVIVLSKLGRPKSSFDPAETLFPAAKRLAELLGKKLAVYKDRLPNYDVHHLIFFTADIRDDQHLEMIKQSPQKDIILLENIRFYSEEESGDRAFARRLASLGDIYVFDAFAMAHRYDVSVAILPEYLPALAGLNVEKELEALNKILTLKKNPFVVLMGGAKISDKVGAIRNLGRSADKILIGGGPANLFFLAKGYEIGKSICEKDKLQLAHEVIRNFKSKLVLPVDVLVARPDFSNPRVCKIDQVKKSEAIFDLGPQSILEFSKHIKTAKKMVWNGPMGLYEKKTFSHGTMAIAELFASKCRGKSYGVVGGGDTLSAVHQAKVLNQIDFVSTGGSAMLDYLGGAKLPGIAVLDRKVKK